jgi:hypothetical protein
MRFSTRPQSPSPIGPGDWGSSSNAMRAGTARLSRASPSVTAATRRTETWESASCAIRPQILSCASNTRPNPCHQALEAVGKISHCAVHVCYECLPFSLAATGFAALLTQCQQGEIPTLANLRIEPATAVGVYWNLATVFFTLAVLPLEPLLTFNKTILILIMSALVAVAILDESRNAVSPD